MSEIADTAFEHQRCASKSQSWERSGRESIPRREDFVFLDTNSATNHLGRHSASFYLGLSGPKPTPYKKGDRLWRLWRLIRAVEDSTHWITGSDLGSVNTILALYCHMMTLISDCHFVSFQRRYWCYSPRLF